MTYEPGFFFSPHHLLQGDQVKPNKNCQFSKEAAKLTALDLTALVSRLITDVNEMILVCYHAQLQNTDFVSPHTQLSIKLTQSLVAGIWIWSVSNTVICVS